MNRRPRLERGFGGGGAGAAAVGGAGAAAGAGPGLAAPGEGPAGEGAPGEGAVMVRASMTGEVLAGSGGDEAAAEGVDEGDVEAEGARLSVGEGPPLVDHRVLGGEHGNIGRQTALVAFARHGVGLLAGPERGPALLELRGG